MPPAVDRESRRADQVHPLEDERPAGQPADRHQQIGKQNQDGAAPADDFDDKFEQAQAAAPRAKWRST